MVADSDLPYFRGYSRQRGRVFGALTQTIGRTAILFLRRYVVPAAKRVGADLLDIAAPEIGNVLTGKNKFKSVAADVGKKTFRKQLGGEKITVIMPDQHEVVSIYRPLRFEPSTRPHAI